jgi:hypothetical protein
MCRCSVGLIIRVWHIQVNQTSCDQVAAWHIAALCARLHFKRPACIRISLHDLQIIDCATQSFEHMAQCVYASRHFKFVRDKAESPAHKCSLLITPVKSPNCSSSSRHCLNVSASRRCALDVQYLPVQVPGLELA